MGKTYKRGPERPYKYFDWDTPNPIGKYKQPIKNDDETGSGYPQTEIDVSGVTVYCRRPPREKKKRMKDIKGGGAAERGKRFHEDD